MKESRGKRTVRMTYLMDLNDESKRVYVYRESSDIKPK